MENKIAHSTGSWSFTHKTLDGQKKNHCYKLRTCPFLLYISLKAMASGKNDDGPPSVFSPKLCAHLQKKSICLL